MALAAWKRIEQSPGFRRLITSLRRFFGTELKLQVEINVDSIQSGGWWFTTQGLSQDSVVYSLGVGDDIAFDLAIIERFGADIHAFDPTPSTIEMLSNTDLPKQFRFHPWAITAHDSTLRLYPRVKKDGSMSKIMYTNGCRRCQ